MSEKSDILIELAEITALELHIEARMIAGLTPVTDENGQAITEKRSNHRIKELALQLFEDKTIVNPILLIITDGGLVFGGRLVEELKLLQKQYPEAGYHFQVMSKPSATYKGTKSTVTAQTTMEQISQSVKDKILLAGRDVVIVDDLADTGATDKLIREDCKRKGATKLRSMVWFNKVQPPGTDKHDPDYCGFNIANKFVLGLGMDYYGLGRNHPTLGFVDEKTIASKGEEYKITTRKEELAQRLEECILKETHYKHATRKPLRRHAFDVVSNDDKFRKKYQNLHGDALKTAILIELKSKLEIADSKMALDTIVAQLETSEEYKILKTGQGIATRLFSLKTDSIRAYQQLVSEAYARYPTVEIAP